jgi:hypothetical protein
MDYFGTPEKPDTIAWRGARRFDYRKIRLWDRRLRMGIREMFPKSGIRRNNRDFSSGLPALGWHSPALRGKETAQHWSKFSLLYRQPYTYIVAHDI